MATVLTKLWQDKFLRTVSPWREGSSLPPRNVEELRDAYFGLSLFLGRHYAHLYKDPHEAQSDAGLAIALTMRRWRPALGHFYRYAKVMARHVAAVRHARVQGHRDRMLHHRLVGRTLRGTLGGHVGRMSAPNFHYGLGGSRWSA